MASTVIPKVTVIVPTYNRAHCISRAIDSVLGQTFTDYELLVVDDGSTDNTEQVLARYGEQVTLIRQANQGASAARNRGISHARGEFVAFLDSDDEWRPEKLARQVAWLEAQPDVGFVSCLGDCFLEKGRRGECDSPPPPHYTLLAAADAYRQFLMFLVTPFPQNMSRYMFRSLALQRAGGFDLSLHGSEDWEIFLHVLQLGYRFDFVPELLVTYHQSEDSISLNPAIMFHGDEQIRRRYVLNIPRLPLRWRINSRFLARMYFSAALAYRQQGTLARSLRYGVQSLVVNPLFPRTGRRLKWLASLLVKDLARSIRPA